MPKAPDATQPYIISQEIKIEENKAVSRGDTGQLTTFALVKGLIRSESTSQMSRRGLDL